MMERDPLIADLARRLRELHATVMDLAAAHNDLRDRHERMFRPGAVTDYDPVAHAYRQQIGIDENGAPIKSPWRPHTQHAGALKLHVPLSVGQQMLLISPDGDIEQGIGLPYGWSDANAAPAGDGGTLSGSFGGVSWSVSGGGVTIAGNLTQTGNLTVSGNVAASGGTLQHNSKDVGSDHKHSGVQTGGGDTGTPV